MGYNQSEFVLDFGQLYVDSEEEVLHTRIITSPIYVSIFLDILQESIRKYERTFRDSRDAIGPKS